MAMDDKRSHVVWGLGCNPSIVKLLKQSGIQLYVMRHFRQFFKSVENALPPRCLLMHTSRLADLSVEGAVHSLRRHWPLVDVVILAPAASADFVRSAFRAGAKDVLLSEKSGVVIDAIEAIIKEQRFLPRMNELTDGLSPSTRFEGLISRSPKMWDLFQTCINIAATDATVLIWGETGTGKELIARALHRRSGRKGAFVVLDCGAVPEHLIDSELFGHVKGSFTGATQDKKGLFRHAHGGTLFLDELGNVPLEVQFRLLRTLQEGTTRPVGGHEELPVDVRVIAATNESIEKMVQEGTFREDLMYRLSVLYMEVPPLRQRKEDILFLFAYFMRKLSEHYQMSRPTIQDAFLDSLLAYDWPGNVRQLENFVERLLLTNASKVLTVEDFEQIMVPFSMEVGGEAEWHRGSDVERESDVGGRATRAVSAATFGSLSTFVAEAEREYLVSCLERCKGHVGESAEVAGISRRSLTRKMKQHNILRAQFTNQQFDEEEASS